MKRVVVVEDDAKVRGSLTLQLREEGFAVEAFSDAETALPVLLAERKTDLLILDVRLPGKSGVELLQNLTAAGRLPATIIVSGEASISETVLALRLGVHDFIEKPFSRERLLHAVHKTLGHQALVEEVASLRSSAEGEGAMLGTSAAMGALRQMVAKAAATDATVLIRGESGVGKELVASTLHYQSERRCGAFIKLNCAAIPANLVEDELFGHARGAFTDAIEAKPGLFEEAHGGTLFLDEIGDMQPPLQARLLRVLEDGCVRRLGETRDRRVDVRVLASTNRDLEQAIGGGEFREDLFFRLAHLVIEVPALRTREGDVPLLVEHFLSLFCHRHRMRPRGVSGQAMELLVRYSWPGNVRELKHLCERLVVFGADPITVDQLPPGMVEQAPSRQGGSFLLLEGIEPVPLRDFRQACEREYIEIVLRRTGWNLSAAARILGIQRTYLHAKLSQLGIKRPPAAGNALD